jgi:hemerythrin-like domain-containing protein
MTDQDEPLEQLIGEHESVAGRLDGLQRELYDLAPGDREGALRLAAELREFTSVVRCHVDVEET